MPAGPLGGDRGHLQAPIEEMIRSSLIATDATFGGGALKGSGELDRLFARRHPIAADVLDSSCRHHARTQDRLLVRLAPRSVDAFAPDATPRISGAAPGGD